MDKTHRVFLKLVITINYYLLLITYYLLLIIYSLFFLLLTY